MAGQDRLDARISSSGDNRDSAVRQKFWKRRLARLAGLALGGVAWPVAVFASDIFTSDTGQAALFPAFSIRTGDVIQLALFVGITGAAILSAILLIRERARTAAENVEFRSRVAELDTALQRSEALLNTREQRIVVWSGETQKPEIVGELDVPGIPADRATFLAFGRWLVPGSAAMLERAITALRDGRQSFDIIVETVGGLPLEAQGRAVASHVAVRFVSLSQERRDHAELKLAHQRLKTESDSLRGLIDALDMPAWLRDGDGRLVWVNHAYSAAVETPDTAAAIADGHEFLGTAARTQIAHGHLSSAVFAQNLSTVIGGDRRVFAVTDFADNDGSAGLACDISEIDNARAQYERTMRSHADTLDKLSTAIAIFDAEQKLLFFNQAFEKLWELDHGFLDSRPDHALLLDRLRAEGRLAEQPEWRGWKQALLEAYRSVEPQEHLWHLPDARTLRVVANPQPDGGVTWVFENLTEKINLESRYNTVLRVQGVTLDNLAEGVAVFGSDGRVRLSNPAFAALWSLPDELTRPETHISAIKAACETRASSSPWSLMVAAATGFDEERRDREGQVELNDGAILRYALVHLPNGQVMTTFIDVTDSVNAERMLKDKNEALERADQLKNDFIQHVSYELRSPLTNIIGFAELLAQGINGPLTQGQRDYVDHIATSSSQLETIVDDILDLATVDAGVMELEITEVPVERTVRSAAELVSERLREHGIRLVVDLSAAPISFHADENRVRQILFNVLSNAANHAPDHSTVRLSCRAEDGGLAFSVHDDGPGIPSDVLDGIFRRFEPHPNGGRRRGAGLGLSIVKSFVELHGGRVVIETGQGEGTTVICRFPMAPEGFRAAAE